MPFVLHGLDSSTCLCKINCLLSKWVFKLCNEEGIWQELLLNKYLKDKTLGQVNKKPGDSYFWTSLMGVKDKFLSLGRFSLKDGSQIRFWEDMAGQPYIEVPISFSVQHCSLTTHYGSRSV